MIKYINTYKDFRGKAFNSQSDAACDIILYDDEISSDYVNTVIVEHDGVEIRVVDVIDVTDDAEEIIKENKREARYDAEHRRSFSHPSSIA